MKNIFDKYSPKGYYARTESRILEVLIYDRLKKYPYFENLEEDTVLMNSLGILLSKKDNEFQSHSFEKNSLFQDFSQTHVILRNKDVPKHIDLLHKVEESIGFRDLIEKLNENELLDLKQFLFLGEDPLYRTFCEYEKLLDLLKQGKDPKIDNGFGTDDVMIGTLLSGLKENDSGKGIYSTLVKIIDNDNDYSVRHMSVNEVFSLYHECHPSLRKTIQDIDTEELYSRLEKINSMKSMENTSTSVMFDKSLSIYDKIGKIFDKELFETLKNKLCERIDLSINVLKLDDYALQRKDILDQIFTDIENDYPQIFNKQNNQHIVMDLFSNNHLSKTDYSSGHSNLIENNPKFVNSLFMEGFEIFEKGQKIENLRFFPHFSISDFDITNYYLNDGVKILNSLTIATYSSKFPFNEHMNIAIAYSFKLGNLEQDLDLFDRCVKKLAKEGKKLVYISDFKPFYGDELTSHNAILKKFADNKDVIIVKNSEFLKKLNAVKDLIVDSPNYSEKDRSPMIELAVRLSDKEYENTTSYLTDIRDQYDKIKNNKDIKLK